MKKFLMVTPQLSEAMLEKKTYVPVDNSSLKYGPVHFSAIPLVAAHVETGEEICVITVTYDIPDCHRNLELLASELSDACKRKGATCSIDSIVVPFDDSITAILNVFQQLISRIEDGDELYADITFGSKPMPIVLTMALQYARRVRKGVFVECVTYGQVSHHLDSREAKIFDVTALVQLDELARMMADNNANDPDRIISELISL